MLILPLSSGLSLNVKENYQMGEDIISSIGGNVAGPISESNVRLLRGHVEVAFEYELKKLGETYFIYGLAPLSSNNYTLEIRDIPTLISGKLQKANITVSINVTNETAPYVIKPGLILTQNDFEITLISNRDITEEIIIRAPQAFNVTVKPGENKIKFSIESFPPGLSKVTIASYEIPVFIIKPENPNDQENKEEILFIPDRINKVVLINEKVIFPIQIVNRGNSTLNLQFIFNENRFKINPEVKEIKPNSVLNLDVTVLDSLLVDENIQVTIGNETFNLPIKISYTENKSEVMDIPANNSIESRFYCIELNGIKCASGQICSGQNVSSLDGGCCLGQCQIPKKSSSYSWVGYLLVVIILIILVIIGGRYLKSKRNKDVFSKRIRSAEKTIS